MEIEKVIRKQVLAGNGDYIRALLLNKHQMELYNLVKITGTFRASLLANTEGVSIQNASSKLNTLWRRGYLKRTCVSSDTGGNEYFYEAAEI
jgi:predicted transcriptional regulator